MQVSEEILTVLSSAEIETLATQIEPLIAERQIKREIDAAIVRARNLKKKDPAP